MNDPVGRNGVRRRRSWYRRRLRIRRILLAVVVGVLLAGAFWQNAARYLLLPSLRSSYFSSQMSTDSFWSRGNIHRNLALAAAQSPKLGKVALRSAGIYPYSVIPGGLKDPSDLRYATLRDYVVRQHYAHFDYGHARLVRASEAREVFLSYRIRDSVFWTRRKVRLPAGELLLTDGNITARARCGNQVSDTAKPEVSDEEPAEDVLDQPVAVMETPSMPIRPVLAPPDLPIGKPVPPALFAGGFIFPYVPSSVPPPSLVCGAGFTVEDDRCHHKHRKPVLPEPSTMLLMASGLAFVLWRYRKTTRTVQL